MTWDLGIGLPAAELQTSACQWILQRADIGLARYGQPLVPDDGRDGLRDAIEEAADLVAYLKNLQRQGRCPDGTYEAAMGVFLDLVAERAPITRGLRGG